MDLFNTNFRKRNSGLLFLVIGFVGLTILITLEQVKNRYNSVSDSKTTSPQLHTNVLPETHKRLDVNSDGAVNIFDYSVMLTDRSLTNLRSDINNDGTVNTIDVSLLLSNLEE